MYSLQEVPRWYAIYTHPNQHERAESNLKAWRVETFNPKSRRILSKNSNSPKYSVKQLFPRYLFARFDATLSHKICFTRGVHSVVSCDGKPAPIDDVVISLLRSRISEDGYIRWEDELKSGDNVIVEGGPLSNFMGVFERNLADAKRVLILLTTVSYQVRVVLEREQVRKLPLQERRSAA
ncbi:MAG TPA: transcription termination/antitermination NusG family protein [Pyrinomonadaceae bacterium]|nr:transcription termination/antitermination NusG family protein [Pyrinomonadaceae bacterium]